MGARVCACLCTLWAERGPQGADVIRPPLGKQEEGKDEAQPVRAFTMELGTFLECCVEVTSVVLFQSLCLCV